MNAGAPAEVLIIRAFGVELVRIGAPFRVAVGVAVHDVAPRNLRLSQRSRCRREHSCCERTEPQSVADPVDIDQDMQRTPEYRVWPVRRRVNPQPGVLHAAKEYFNRGVYLQPRELTAKADVYAGAPPEALFLLTFEVEFVGVGEPLRITIRGAIHEVDRRTLRDCGPGDLDVVESRPGGPKVDRRLEAQHLLDGAWNQLRPPAQQVDGPGVPQQRQHAVGDEVDCRVMTGDEYKDAIVYDLAGGHASVRAAVVHQLRDHAVGGVFLRALDEPDHVFLHSHRARLALRCAALPLFGGRFRAEIEPREEVRYPGVELGFVL